MRTFALFISLVAMSLGLQAQSISGIVNDENGKPAKGVTVTLHRTKDSAAVKFAATTDKGAYSFSGMPAGSYRVSTSHVGYNSGFSAPFDFSGADISLPVIGMAKMNANLQGVTVTARKPMIEVKADKTILNVEGTINSVGNDALELLRKAPGVMVDKDDNLSLAGKNGVQVFIDGKPSPLSGSDLSNFLKSLQSAQVESIEIITNPSAKYEAAGNAGIINIRLKKNKSYGTNGSVNAGVTQGHYTKYNAGFSINNRNKYVNVFGTYNYNNGKNLMQMNMRKEQLDTLFTQSNRMTFENISHGFKAGVDYFINAKSTIGAVINGNVADNNFLTEGPMYFTYIPTGQLNRILKASNTNIMTRDNINTNLNYRYANKGKELNLDADYGFFKLRGNQYQPNIYYQADGTTEINRAIYNMIAPTDIDIMSFKADYEQDFKGGRLGLGTKIGYVQTDNDFQRYDVYSSWKVMDTLKSNRFKYDENINAVYASYNKQYKKGFMFQAGLRVENTHSSGNSTGFKKPASSYVPYDSTFTRDYTDFFPSASITYNKNPMNQWTVSYSRRIDRPVYQDLNPFEFKLNEYTFMKGNTTLRPQYTNSFGITNIYKYKLTTTLNYSHVTDIFAQIPDTIDKTKGFLTKKNLANQDVVSLTVAYPFSWKWYSFYSNMNANYSHYQADLGGGNRKIDQEVYSLTYFMQNSFKLGKGFTAELTALYISPSIWAGLIRSKAMGSVDVGLQKTILKGKGTLRGAVSDVFQTMKWGGTTRFAGVYSTFSGHAEMPQYKLNFSYRFGNSQVKAARQRKSALEEELKRTQQSGGGMGGQ